MTKLIETLKEEDSGEIMLESVIVILITLFMLVAILSLGFAYYQQSMLTTVANETAELIGANYKYTSEADIDNLTLDADSIENLRMFRTSFGINAMKDINQNHAEIYVPKRIAYTNLGINKSAPTLSSWKVEVDNVGRLHVDITVQMETEILFQGALKYFGIIKDTPKFTASARAECLDITAYASHISFSEYLENNAGMKAADSIIKIINSGKKIIEVFVGDIPEP